MLICSRYFIKIQLLMHPMQALFAQVSAARSVSTVTIYDPNYHFAMRLLVMAGCSENLFSPACHCKLGVKLEKKSSLTLKPTCRKVIRSFKVSLSSRRAIAGLNFYHKMVLKIKKSCVEE